MLILLMVMISGCSATSLRCSVDGDSSYVELYNLPQNVSQNIRAYTEVCAFAYDKTPEVVFMDAPASNPHVEN